MKKQLIKLVSVLYIITNIFHLVEIISLASPQTDTIEVENELDNNVAQLMNNTPEVGSSNLTFSIIEPEFLQAGTTCVMFDPTDVISCSYVSEGLQVVRDDEILTKFTITANDDFGKISVTAQKSDGSTMNQILYTYLSGNKIYVSDVSTDGAWFNSKETQLSNGSITLLDLHRQYSSFSALQSEEITGYSFENNQEINQAVSEGKIVVRGKMTWRPAANKELPLRHTKVELRNWEINASGPLASTYTDENGYYYFIFDPDEWSLPSNLVLGLFVRIYLESNTLSVVYPFTADFNYFDSSMAVVTTSYSGIIDISRRIKNNDDCVMYRLLYIQQGMVLGQRFATKMGMDTNQKLFVFYLGDFNLNPQNIAELNNIDFVNNLASLNNVAFCYDVVSIIGHSYYNDFATLIHEYGHFVEHRIGTYGSAVKGHIYDAIPDDFNGVFSYLEDFYNGYLQVKEDYTHSAYGNHFDKINTTKAFQMELAWSEAWASAFAEVAHNHYIEDYTGALYSGSVNYETNIEANGAFIDQYDGEAHEYAVASFLWDLFDSYSASETDDNVSMDEQDWWDITTESGICTIQDFSENILENYPELISGVGELMSKHNISPEIYYLAYNHATDSSPRLLWNKNGGQNYRNNIFRVAFYDNENNLLGITDEINSYTDSSPFTVPTALWNTVMAQEKVNTIIYAVVYGYRSGSSVSGPYFSARSMVYDGAAYHTSHTATYTKTSSMYHIYTCSCGFVSENEEHFSYTYSSIRLNGSYHKAYCACGQLIGNEPHRFTTVMGRFICRDCGYERIGSGEIIMGKKEDELLQ